MEISRRHPANRTTFACSDRTSKGCEHLAATKAIPRINIKAACQALIKDFDVIISMHCTQIFPADLVANVRCINFHPGLNPYNRGWYPQVFSILNGKPFGVTIHEMDAKIDHGPIIYQEEIPIRCHETSKDVYTRVLRLQLELFDEWIGKLISKNYESTNSSHAGNYNSRADFEALKTIDLDKTCTPRAFIDLLRALTFPPYQNAYFIDDKTGLKQFVRIEIEPEK